jgi:hypothetical protein
MYVRASDAKRHNNWRDRGFSQSERSALTFIRFDVCVLSSVVAVLTLAATGQAQNTPPPATPAAQVPQSAPVQVQGPKTAVPDYPDPRTLTLGAFYWFTGPGVEPSYYGGSQALDFETLKNWGKPHRSPGVEAIFPISRTGELHFEYFRAKGDGNQTASSVIDIFGATYNPGDYLATQYQLQTAKLYLDDLLFPHKFPVSKFRVKSLWEVEWVQIKGTIDAPFLDAASLASSGTTASASVSHQIIYPVFGLAAEYALSPHVLLRASASGFGLYHKADIGEAEATIAYRRGMWEIRGGGKAFHFKTSPNSTEYASGTLTGAFVGLRWHWSL